MKHLIIYSHLNPKSFTNAVVKKIEKSLNGDNEVKIIDLYKDNFNPVLQFPDIEYGFMDKEAPIDVEEYQKMIAWADNLIFVFPLWWCQMPAILKGFIDRTFTNGFAYRYTGNGVDQLLKDKTAQLFINTGSGETLLTSIGAVSGLKDIFIKGIFAFCGIKAKVNFLFNVASGPQELREQYLNDIEKLVK